MPWLHWVVVVSVALLVALTGLSLWRSHALIVADYLRTTDDAARLLKERAERTVTAGDIVLRRVAEEVQRRGLGLFRTAPGAAWLDEMAEALPAAGSMWLLDADGTLVATSVAHPAPPEKFADREYYPLHRAGLPFQIGHMVMGRVVKRHAFTLSRRVGSADGGLAGIVVAAIDCEAFASLLGPLGLPEGAGVGLYRADGAVMFRQPLPGGPEPAQDGGLESVHHLDGVPLFAAAQIPQEAIGKRWMQEITVPLLLSVMGVSAVAVFGALAVNAARREQALLRKLSGMVGDLQRESSVSATVSAEKSRFVAALSHDIRQPVQSLLLMSSMLRGSLSRQQTESCIDMIDRSLDTLRGLLDELLDLSRLELGAAAARRDPVHLGVMLRRLDQEYRLRAEKLGLRFKALPSSAVVVTDARLLERVLRNLIENALKYTGSGRILVGCRHRPDGYTIEVHDTGPGIPQDQLELIWREFHQIENPSRDLNKGLGLGLAIVRRLAVVLGHRVSVDSTPGRGSCFRVHLQGGARAVTLAPPAAAAASPVD